MGDEIERVAEGNEPAKKVAYFLRDEVGTIDGWKLGKILGTGANGVVFTCKHKDHPQVPAVCKVAITAASSGSLLWETNVMNRIVAKHSEDRSQHLVRIHASGTLELQNEEQVGYVIMESLPGSVGAMIDATGGPDAAQRVACEGAIHTLKALFDLHYLGFIHRDIKPENIGGYNGNTAVMYDMGMVRVVTEPSGKYRPSRHYVGLRGTDEWASLNSEMGREQTYLDDMWGWLYTVNEWINGKSKMPQAWATVEYSQMDGVRDIVNDVKDGVRKLMKSNIFSAQHLLANCPSQLFKIQIYLRSLGSYDAIDYLYIASLLHEGRKGAKRKKAQNIRAEEFHENTKFLEKQFF